MQILKSKKSKRLSVLYYNQRFYRITVCKAVEESYNYLVIEKRYLVPLIKTFDISNELWYLRFDWICVVNIRMNVTLLCAAQCYDKTSLSFFAHQVRHWKIPRSFMLIKRFNEFYDKRSSELFAQSISLNFLPIQQFPDWLLIKNNFSRGNSRRVDGKCTRRRLWVWSFSMSLDPTCFQVLVINSDMKMSSFIKY